MVISGSPNLLITDDDRDLRESLAEALRRDGYQTTLAADGFEALDIIGRQPIHLMLLDIEMPRLDGLETARRLRQADFPLPIIFMSATLDELRRQQVRANQAFAIWDKPIDRVQMREDVSRALRLVYGWPVDR